MKILKGIDKLNKAVSAPFKQFGIEEVLLSDTYSYYRGSSIITYKITEDIEDKWFSEFIEQKFNISIGNQFIISLFHEIGHHMTDDDIPDDIYFFCNDSKANIVENMTDEDDLDTLKFWEDQYFNLPDEMLATTWAVDYITKHPKKVKKIAKKIFVALAEFLRENEVDY